MDRRGRGTGAEDQHSTSYGGGGFLAYKAARDPLSTANLLHIQPPSIAYGGGGFLSSAHPRPPPAQPFPLRIESLPRLLSPYPRLRGGGGGAGRCKPEDPDSFWDSRVRGWCVCAGWGGEGGQILFVLEEDALRCRALAQHALRPFRLDRPRVFDHWLFEHWAFDHWPSRRDRSSGTPV